MRRPHPPVERQEVNVLTWRPRHWRRLLCAIGIHGKRTFGAWTPDRWNVANERRLWYCQHCPEFRWESRVRPPDAAPASPPPPRGTTADFEYRALQFGNIAPEPDLRVIVGTLGRMDAGTVLSVCYTEDRIGFRVQHDDGYTRTEGECIHARRPHDSIGIWLSTKERERRQWP